MGGELATRGALKAKPGKSMVVVYFPKGVVGVLTGYHVRVGESNQSASIGRGEFSNFDVDPGHVSVSSEPDKLVKGAVTASSAILSAVSGPGLGIVSQGATDMLTPSATDESTRMSLQVKEGKTHYLKIGVGAWRETIKEVPENLALKHLRNCHWLNQNP